MTPDPKSVRKDALDKANDLIDRLATEGPGSQLFTTEFKDRFIDEVRASDMYQRSDTTQEATEAIIAVFERTMTQISAEDSIKAPLRSAFVLRLIGTA